MVSVLSRLVASRLTMSRLLVNAERLLFVHTFLLGWLGL